MKNGKCVDLRVDIVAVYTKINDKNIILRRKIRKKSL